MVFMKRYRFSLGEIEVFVRRNGGFHEEKWWFS